MRVLAESNFVLELTFRKELYLFYEQIHQDEAARAYALHLPQYALMQVFEKLRPLRNQREANQQYLLKKIIQHRHEAEHGAEAMHA